MNSEINLTGSEWDIMKIIWEKQPCTLRQICDAVKKQHDWSRHAVISFLKRMETKGTIYVEDADPVKLYTAAVSQDDAIRQEMGSTMSRLFNDSPMMLVSYIAQSNRFTDKEIEQMIDILKEGEDRK
ncbi:MAG: BlaI/MecI/CopY family transcriptional regulator [Saccharofermentans sp.]|nr:BlaI/MecI/CopY family transcriptional regulator [Saccharofermentans sp.]